MSPCTAHDFEAIERPTTPFPFNRIPSNLKIKPAELVPALRKAIDNIILHASKCKDAAEFRSVRQHDMDEYSTLIQALSKFVFANVDRATHAKLVEETLSSNEQRFKVSALDVIGIDAANEALFYFVTMRKTFDLVRSIMNKSELDEKEKFAEDRSLSKRCSDSALWFSYHYEIILAAVSKRHRLPNDILRQTLDGLKFADIAYTAAKQGYLLRYPEKARHKYYANEHPCDHVGRGNIEQIAEDSIKNFDDWAPYRERANKPPLPQ
jgi:hypothetical protein